MKSLKFRIAYNRLITWNNQWTSGISHFSVNSSRQFRELEKLNKNLPVIQLVDQLMAVVHIYKKMVPVSVVILFVQTTHPSYSEEIANRWWCCTLHKNRIWHILVNYLAILYKCAQHMLLNIFVFNIHTVDTILFKTALAASGWQMNSTLAATFDTTGAILTGRIGGRCGGIWLPGTWASSRFSSP